MRRLIDATAGVSDSRFYVTITASMMADLKLWKCFLIGFNGSVFWLPNSWDSNFDFSTFTDASGKKGFGAICGSQWAYGKWSDRVVGNFEIEFKELFPIVLACVLWGDFFSNKRVLFMCDNLPVVHK